MTQAVSLNDNFALRDILVVLVVELVRAGLERTDDDLFFMARGQDFFGAEIVAFELCGRRIVIGDMKFDARVRRQRNFGRGEMMILQSQRDRTLIGGMGSAGDQNEGGNSSTNEGGAGLNRT